MSVTILSSLYVCKAIKHIIVLLVETPRKFIAAKLSIRKPGSSSVLIISLRSVSTNKTSYDIVLLHLLYIQISTAVHFNTQSQRYKMSYVHLTH